MNDTTNTTRPAGNMTGPEHYREAERLLAEAVETNDGQPADSNITRAQVHATLALAAATALSDHTEADYDAWQKAAGTVPVRRARPVDAVGDQAGCNACKAVLVRVDGTWVHLRNNRNECDAPVPASV